MRFQKKVKLAYLKDRYDKIEKAICLSIPLFSHTTTNSLVEDVIKAVSGVTRKDILAVAEELKFELQIFYDKDRDIWLLTPVNL